MPKKYDETENFIRVRQQDPRKFDKDSFRTVDTGRKRYTELIVACPKGKYNKKRKLCTVALEIQSVILNKRDFGGKKKALEYYAKNFKGKKRLGD